MGGRVAAELALVVAHPCDLALVDDDGADGHVVVLAGALGLAQRDAHEMLVEGEEPFGHRGTEPTRRLTAAPGSIARVRLSRVRGRDPLRGSGSMTIHAPLLLRTRAALVGLLVLCVLAVTPALLSLARPQTIVPAGGLSAPFEPGVVVVGFRPGTSATARRGALVHAGLVGVADIGDGFTTVALRPGMSVPAAVAALSSQHGVAWAVPDYIAHAAQLPPPYYPDDPGNSGQPGGWEALQWNFAGAFGVGAPQAWANVAADGAPGGAGVIVAVLDTGIAYANHRPYVRSPDFRPGQFVPGYDFIAHDSTPYDRNGHGTQVAGTIAEATNNHIGLTGLAYGAKLMPVRVLDSQGDGGASTIARGIYFAVDHHAQVINLSLEFTAGTVRAASTPELISAIDYAHSKDVMVVAASGNDDAGQLSYPAKAHWSWRRRHDGRRLPRLLLELRSRAHARRTGRRSRQGHPGGPPLPPRLLGGHRHLPGDLRRHRIAEPARVRAAVGLLRDLDGSAACERDRGADHRERHPRATPDGRRAPRRLIATATPLGADGGDHRHYGAGLVNAGAATAPIGSTGTTGPSGPTGPTGTTGATGATEG